MTEMPPGGAVSSGPSASSVAAAKPSWAVPERFLTADFGQQCTNLQNQYTRMHGRMQLITGLNTALLPALGALAAAAGRDDLGHPWLFLFPAAGLLLSVIGYVAGAADRHLVVLYRNQLARAAKSLLVLPEVAEPEAVYAAWAHAGRDPDEVEKIVEEPLRGYGPGDEPIDGEHAATTWWDRLTSWRWNPMSVTRLPALLSLVFMLVWLVVLVLLAVTGSSSAA